MCMAAISDILRLSALHISSLPSKCILDPHSPILYKILKPMLSDSKTIDIMRLTSELLDIQAAFGCERVLTEPPEPFL